MTQPFFANAFGCAEPGIAPREFTIARDERAYQAAAFTGAAPIHGSSTKCWDTPLGCTLAGYENRCRFPRGGADGKAIL